ncbi:hypothetical protein B7G54_15190 [Burkholderia puraquae]|uniref:Uncharacterized protein n=1 Tax=Burkholderia puraquae TaxID=1904757 RepID=A0A1X1PHP1_9BURK|nr:hypothetical protein B7G54_15190 [Burkholderia puraquae]
MPAQGTRAPVGAPLRRPLGAPHKLITKRYKPDSRPRHAGFALQLQCRFWRKRHPIYTAKQERFNDSRCDRRLHQVQIHGLRGCVPGGLLP